MRDRFTAIVLAVAAIVGAGIGYIDSRPTWDDTGITVAAVILAAAMLAAFRPRVAWWVGLAVGAPVVAFNALARGEFGSIIALAIGLFAAGIGGSIGRTLASGGPHRST